MMTDRKVSREAENMEFDGRHFDFIHAACFPFLSQITIVTYSLYLIEAPLRNEGLTKPEKHPVCYPLEDVRLS